MNRETMHPISVEILQSLKAKFADNGQAFKIRYIDKDPAKGLLGVRITNAAKLLEEAWTIAIMDRHTVSIAIGGMDMEHHISLTEEDGEDFMDYLKTQLPPELWDMIPEGQPKADAPSSVNVELANLVKWLADTYPAQFGSYGTATTSPDFYTALMDLLSSIDRDYRDRRDFDYVVLLESVAHGSYTAAGRQLAAVEFAADENMRQEHRIEALTWIATAKAQVNQALIIRSRLALDGKATPPPAKYPEIPDITADALRDRIIDVSLEERTRLVEIDQDPHGAAGNLAAQNLAPPPQPRRNDLNDGRALLTGPDGVALGEMVICANNNTPQFRQMGSIVELEPEFATVRFAIGSQPVPLNYGDLVKLQ